MSYSRMTLASLWLATVPYGCAESDGSDLSRYVAGENKSAKVESKLADLTAADSPEGAAGPFSEFRQTVETSKMLIGSFIAMDRHFEFDRVVGTDGVLAFGRHGVTLGVPNANGAGAMAPAFPGSGEEHNEKVTEYFLSAGLPKSQLGPRYIHAMMAEASSIDDQLARRAKPFLVGYTTVLDRQIDGVPVRGSYAWASFNADGNVVSEEIFWPALDRSLAAVAHAFEARFQVPEAGKSFAEVLPSEYRSKKPVIVVAHSPHFQDTFEAVVVAEFPGVGTGPAQRFLESGQRFLFKYESTDGLSSETIERR